MGPEDPARHFGVPAVPRRHRRSCIDDEAAMLAAHGDWIWARRESNPVGGWYGLRKGYRGRCAMYVPPLLEHLGLVELEHNPKNNRVRAK